MGKKIKQSIQEIVKFYFVCRNQYSRTCFSSGQADYTNPFYVYYRDVEIALSLISPEDRYIIESEFFSLKRNENWWKKQYSANAFSKKKDKAFKNFVRVFYEIH